MGNLLKTNFSETGEIMGFEMKPELPQMMHLYNDLNPLVLQRTIKCALFLNRIIKYGQEEDFMLKQMQGVQPLEDFEKEYADCDIQVDVLSLQEHAKEGQDSESGKHDERGSPRSAFFDTLKDHVSQMMGRVRPERKGYYKMIFEGMDTERLLAF